MFSNINIYRTATNNIIDLCQEPLECPDRPKLGQLTVSSSAWSIATTSTYSGCDRIRDTEFTT